jgi:urease accessory protein
MKAVEAPFVSGPGAPCEARLALGFTDDDGVTRLTDRRHFGPLRVQKALYPEHASVCHAILIHPPGGVVGGDRLQIDIDLAARANALITTPGAAKWYKANRNGLVSRQQVTLRVAAGAALEWLPQETIFFNRAQVRLEHHVELAADARYIGAEILCFGRTASGEVFDEGRVAQHTSIRRDGKLLWWEQGVLDAQGGAMQSPLALAGSTVCATLIAVGNRTQSAELIAALRGVPIQDHANADPQANTGVTQIKSLLVARYLGHSSAAARAWVSACWQLLRPVLLDRPAIVPRIWHT